MQCSLRFRILIAAFALAFASLAAQAQNADRLYQEYTLFDDYLEITTSDGRLVITPFSDKVVEVQFLTARKPANEASYAVIQTPAKVATEFNESDTGLRYSTAGIAVDVNFEPFQVTYSYRGRPLISEQAGYFETLKGIGFSFNLDRDEALYGGGERALKMDRRGYALTLYNTPAYGYGDERDTLYYSIPLLISSKQYMLLWDNPAKGSFDIGKTDPNLLTLNAIGGRSAYYLVAGDDFYDLTSQYTALTGRQPLPPRWTLGNFASRFGYRTQEEAQTTIDKFLDDQIPVDAIVIDLYWFGKDIQGHMGNFSWDTDAWPTPEKMMKRFDKQGVNTVMISEPFILKTSKRWQEAVDAGVFARNYKGEPYVFDFYFGTSGLIDVFKPEARTWFWNIYKQLTKQGVDAWWGDLGEPESHAADMVHAAGTAEYLHNAYGHRWAQMMFDGMAADFPERRPFVLMRAGFAGSQRYGMVPWSGDVTRNWPGLRTQPQMALQMGMQGLAYAHSDLGGFADHSVDGVVQKDAELYIRWLQYGIYQPIYRPHSFESVPAEPVYWDAATKAIVKQAIELRYRLLPYNYTLAYDNASKGYPLMRPLFFAEPDNAALKTYTSAYLWGDNLLVAPILEKGQTEQTVYFPAGSNWVDWYSGQRYRGGSSATVALSLDHIPTFVRSGAFLPMLREAPQNTSAYSTAKLDVHYFVDSAAGASQYTLYDDDGHSNDSMAKGQYELLYLSATPQAGGIHFNVAPNGGSFKGRPKARELSLVLHQLANAPASVTVDGKTLAYAQGGRKAHLSTLPSGETVIVLPVKAKPIDVVLTF